jgi:hypothetical protein
MKQRRNSNRLKDYDYFQIMANHIHGIIQIAQRTDAIHRVSGQRVTDRDAINGVCTNGDGIKKSGIVPGKKNPMVRASLSGAIRYFKARSSHMIRRSEGGQDFAWLPRFHDHIIRNARDL